MGVWHEIIKGRIDDLVEDQQWAVTLLDIQQKAKSGFWDQEYLDSIFQNHYTGYDIYDAYCFGEIHYAIGSGKIARAMLHVGREPMRDRFKKENNAALQNLPEPFSANFVGGSYDEDGALIWNSSIELNITPANQPAVRISIEEGSAELEVGYQKSHKTLAQLKNSRCLARWPYHSEWIHLFVVVDRDYWQLGDD